jgi:poly-gamma-glutamate synthesis protein (capsule biosynthesis protein)
VTVVATGDSILTRPISGVARPGFSELVDLVRAGDVSITNLEMVFPGSQKSASTTAHGTPLAVDPSLLSEFHWMGFNVYSMANNHATDYGTDGLKASLAELKKRGMAWAGAGHTLTEARRPAYFQAPGGRVAFIAAGSSNARLSVAGDPGVGDIGRPGIAPVRIQKTHFVRRDRYGSFRDTAAEMGVDVSATGTTAPGIMFPYPDKNVWAPPPPGGFAIEGVNFAPADHPHIHTGILGRDTDALVKSVREAARQADLVFVGLHCHEGTDGRWNSDLPAEFLQPLCHGLIDAGAHGVLAHGPHMLRGMELYRNRPICYSLGNFIFTLETISSFPVELYEHQEMPLDSTTADLYDRVTGYQAQRKFWESVVVEFKFDDGEFTGSRIRPITMGNDLPRSQRGCPVLAEPGDGERILTRLDEMSQPYQTRIRHKLIDGWPVGEILRA